MAGKRAARHKGTGDESRAAAVAAFAAVPEAPVGVAAGTVITLPADCRIAAQASLKADLLGALGADAMVLDGRSVERIDTAALQLLMVFQRELDARGGTLSWYGTSDALDEAAGLLGLAQILKLPAAVPV